MSDTSENLKLYSVKDMVAFLHATYNFSLELSYFCILDKFQNIEDIFGQDGFIKQDSITCIFYTNSRWTYFGDTIYFKSEDDLIEFKLRFL